MKHSWRFRLFTFALALVVALPQLRAQDVMVVEWETTPGSGEPKKNALWEAIMGDTVAGGARANLNRVYQLKKGGYYWITERIVNNGWPLRIVGEPAGSTAMENPPVIQMVARDNGTVDGRMITGLGDLELRNLWLTGRDDNGVQTYYQPIQFDGNGYRVIVDNCVLEQTNFALIAFTGKNNKIYFTNNKFRNLIGKPSSQQWEGRGISIWADQDTVVVENNTFFNMQFTVLQIEGGSAKYLRFNHNTMVNVGRNFMTGNWFQEAYFANNLIVNGGWHGEGYNDYSNPGRDPRDWNSGMWSIGPLPTKYGLEEGRRILLAKTACWRDPFFATKYADTIRPFYFVNPVTRIEFLDKLNDQGQKAYPQMRVVDTMWLTQRPNFQTYPGNEDGYPASMLDSMWSNITLLRSGVTPATDYHYKPTEYPVQVTWPLPESFAYTEPANLLTAGTDGLPLGDLNWFPDKKAQFEANKAQYIAQIQDMAGPRIVITPVADYECESGTLSGTATVQTFSGFAYFQMDGGGWIQWDFDLAQGGQYDLNVWTHLRGNSMRGQRIIVNGVSIHDPKGWGEYIWAPDEAGHPTYGMPTNEWTWSKIRQSEILEADALTLPAGHNTIRIESSWGWQNFAGIDVIPAGTSTPAVQLRAWDATFEVVQLKAEGAPWVPSNFKSVALGSAGTVTLNVNVAEAGNYLFALYYQNGSADAKWIWYKVDNTSSVEMSLPGKTDSTGLSKISNVFPLTAGSHTITFGGGDGVNIDYIKLSKQEVISDVDAANVPYTFSLEQNYPNPFNPATTINFSIGKPSNVKLVVYNILGQKVATLVDTRMEAGQHTIVFDGAKLASGVYFYKLEAGDFRAVKKMLLLK